MSDENEKSERFLVSERQPGDEGWLHLGVLATESRARDHVAKCVAVKPDREYRIERETAVTRVTREVIEVIRPEPTATEALVSVAKEALQSMKPQYESVNPYKLQQRLRDAIDRVEKEKPCS